MPIMASSPLSVSTNLPAHMQPSLPALPSHLQSDTHLTAHLASRSVNLVCDLEDANKSLGFTYPYPRHAFPRKLWSVLTPILPHPRGQMEGRKEVPWERPKILQDEPGHASVPGEKIKLSFSCKASYGQSMRISGQGTNTGYLEARVDPGKLPSGLTYSHRF